MAKKLTITKNTLSPVVINPADQPAEDALVLAENASKVSVYTGTSKKDSPVTTNIVGSGLKAALKTVAAGATFAKGLSTNEQWLTDKKGNPVPVKGSKSAVEINSDNHIILNGVSVKSVYGGALALTEKGKITTKYIAGVTAETNADVSITLNNTTATKVFGGGGGYGSVVNGNASIVYSGGNVKTIYGGGDTGSVLNGDVSIRIGGKAAGRMSKIYAGGYNSVVNGDATVTFTNNAGLYKLGTVSGGGQGKKSLVTGVSTLVFENFSGDFNTSITDFNYVKITGKSSVTLKKSQHKTMRGATYMFVITDETLGLQEAMLTWNSKVLYSNIVVSVTTASAFDVTLIQSTKFKKETDFNTASISVVNGEGEELSKRSYTLTYNYDKKIGGSVSITYTGLNLTIDTTEPTKLVTSGADDEINVVAGGNLAGGLNTSGGNDIIRLQRGSEVHGPIQAGEGDDTLYIQQGALLTGEVDMGKGNDAVYIEDGALVTSNIALGEGVNQLTVQKQASLTGTVIFSDDSTNTVLINGAVMSFQGGNAGTYNFIILSGDAVHGGGVGYWSTAPAGRQGEAEVFVVRDLTLLGEGNDAVVINNHTYVNNIYLGGGNDKLTINQGAKIGYEFASMVLDGDRIPATINLGTGRNILVLNMELANNVNVIAEADGNVVVVGADMAIDSSRLLLGSTGNTLVVTNGRQITFNNMNSLGNFLVDGAKFEALYLSLNAAVNVGNNAVIQNYSGNLTRLDGTILIAGTPDAVPDDIAEYYTAGDGVKDSRLTAQQIEIFGDAKVTATEMVAGGVSVLGVSVVDNSKGGFISTDDIYVSEKAAVKGDIFLGYNPVSETGTPGGDAEIAGAVDSLLGGDGNDTVRIARTAKIGKIDLGGGNNDRVDFVDAGEFTDEKLVISNVEGIRLADDADVTVKTAAGYNRLVLGWNSLFTEVDDLLISVGARDEAISFAEGYTVRLLGDVNAEATLNGNTVLLNARKFNSWINLFGANTFSVAAGALDWYDWQQFKFNTGASLGFELGDYAFFAIDGFVDVAAEDLIDATTFGQNSALGLGSWIYIQDWEGGFDLANFSNIILDADFAFVNLNVVADAEIWGGIVMDAADNELIIDDGVVMNGRTDLYDYAVIQTLGGNDTVSIGKAVINGRVDLGAGDDMLILNGTTINAAINQATAVVNLGAGNDTALFNEATVNGDVEFGAGNDFAEINASTVNGDIRFGAGNDIAEINASTVSGDVTLGMGDDFVTLDASTVNGNIRLGAGDDLVILNASTVNGNVEFDSGKDRLTSVGDSTIAGDVVFGADDNAIMVESGTLTVDEIVSNGFPIANNAIDVMTDAELRLAGELVLGAQTSNTVTLDGGTLSVIDTVSLNSADNFIALANGGVIDGLKDLEMQGGVNIIDIADDLTSQTMDTLTMAGSGNQVTNRGEFTVTGAAAMSAVDGDNFLNNGDTLSTGELSMAATNGNNAIGNVGVMNIAAATMTADDINRDGSGGNLVVNQGELSIGTLDMDGVDNQITNSGTLKLEGATTMDGRQNTIDISATEAATIALSATEITMSGRTNRVDGTAFFDATVGDGAEGGRVVESGPVSQTFTADTLSMNGRLNQVAFGVEALTDGEYDNAGNHYQSKLVLGEITQSLAADVVMTGGRNGIGLGIELDSDEEGDLYASAITVKADGDLSMTGRFNLLNAAIDLTAGSQSTLTLDGNLSIEINGDIHMDATRENILRFGVNRFEMPADPPNGESGGVILGNGLATVTVNGDIVMVGIGATNRLHIYENASHTGSVKMGEARGDRLSDQNILQVEDVSSINFTSLEMTAVENEVTLNGEGTIASIAGIQGGRNTLEIGQGVVIQSPIVFNDVIDRDGIGTEGYTILANTENRVRLYGSAAGINSGATNANDSFRVIGGLVTGDIITGSSATGDRVRIGGVDANDLDKVNPRNESVVEGDVSMGTVESAGNNRLAVIASVVTDPDGNEIAFDASIGGSATMISKDGSNQLAVIGADTAPDADGNFDRITATIGGNVSMIGTANAAIAIKAGIGGDMDIVATAEDNDVLLVDSVARNIGLTAFDENELRVIDSDVLDVSMIAGDDNELRVIDSDVLDVSMIAGYDNELRLIRSTAADVTLIAGGDNDARLVDADAAVINLEALGSNDVRLIDSTAEGITLTADVDNTLTVRRSETESIAMDAGNDNTLNLSGTFTPLTSDPDLPAEDQEQKVVRSTVEGDVMMVAVGRNTVNLGEIGNNNRFGSVTITGALLMSAQEANELNVHAGTQSDFSDPAAAELDMRALAGSINMNALNNRITIDNGTLGVTDGELVMSNVTPTGELLGNNAKNVIAVSATSLLVLEQGGITMGSKSVALGSSVTSGVYDDADHIAVIPDANGYEIYLYQWHSSTVVVEDAAAATRKNKMKINGKVFADSLTMTAQFNIVSITGPAEIDPSQSGNTPYDLTEAVANFNGDVKQEGRVNVIKLLSGNYDARLTANSVTMGDVEVKVDDTKTVKILAEHNVLYTENNSFITVGDVTMTSTDTNSITIGSYHQRLSTDDRLAADKVSKLVNTAGAAADNYIKAAAEDVTNELGNIVMTANGRPDQTGGVTGDGKNSLELGQNSEALDVTMKGYENDVTLAGGTFQIGYLVDPVTGVPVLDLDDNQKTEELTIEKAAVIGNLVFKLPDAMLGTAPANTVTMGDWTYAASITSEGAAKDSITMEAYALIDGDVDLAGGDDLVFMGQGSRIAGALLFGAGADALSVLGSATVGSIDFGADSATEADELTLQANALFTVADGDITFEGTLDVTGTRTSVIVFDAEDAGFTAVGEDAKLTLTDAAIFGGIDGGATVKSQMVILGNGTLENGSLAFTHAAEGALGVMAQPNKLGGDTFTVAETASVDFVDSGEWVWGSPMPTATNDLVRINDDAKLVLDGVVNFGLGANLISLGEGSGLEVNKAWTARLDSVNADGEAVNVAGQTVAQWIAEDPVGHTADNFVAEVQNGGVTIMMADGSALVANTDIAANGGIYLLNSVSGEVGQYLISGPGTITANITVDKPAESYELILGVKLAGDLTFGSGNDALFVMDDSEVETLSFGLGDDSLELAANLEVDALDAFSLTINGTGGSLSGTTLTVDNLTIGSALTFDGTAYAAGDLILALGDAVVSGSTFLAFTGTNDWTPLSTGDFDVTMAADALDALDFVTLTDSGFDADFANWNKDADNVLTDFSLVLGGTTTIADFVYDAANKWATATAGAAGTWRLSEETDGSLRLAKLA